MDQLIDSIFHGVDKFVSAVEADVELKNRVQINFGSIVPDEVSIQFQKNSNL